MTRGSKVALIVAIAVAVLTVTLLATPRSAADEAAPPTVAPSPATTIQPASDLLVARALSLRRHFYRDLPTTNRARTCFGITARYTLLPRPARSAPESEWVAALAYWRWRVQRQHDRFAALRHRMTHPSGNGAERWRPLVRWHWPAWLVPPAMKCLGLESGGDYLARNASGAAGLFQLCPAPARWADPDYNVWYAYWHKYRPAGNFSAWVVMH